MSVTSTFASSACELAPNGLDDNAYASPSRARTPPSVFAALLDGTWPHPAKAEVTRKQLEEGMIQGMLSGVPAPSVASPSAISLGWISGRCR